MINSLLAPHPSPCARVENRMKIASLILIFGLLVPARPLASQQADLKWHDDLARIDDLTLQWVLPAADSLCKVLADSVASRYGPRSFELTEVLLRRLRVARASSDSTAGAQARELVELRRALVPSQDARLVPVLIEAARVATRAGEYERSRLLLQESLTILQAASPRDSLHLADVHQEMGVIDFDQRNPLAAEPQIEEAYRLRRRVLGEQNRDTAKSRLFRGIVKLQTNRPAAARSDYQAAMKTLRATLGDHHPEYLWALNAYASFLQSQSEFAAARTAYEAILKIKGEQGSAKDLAAAWTLNNLAGVTLAMADYPQAESLYLEASEIRRSFLGAHPLTAKSLTGCGTMVLLRGDYARARQLLDEAYSIFVNKGLTEEPDAALCLMNQGFVHYWTGDTDEARDDYAAARPTLLRKGRPQDQVTCLEGLAECLATQGRTAEAEAAYREALGIAQKAFGPNSHHTGLAHISLAQALSHQRRFAAADSAFVAGLQEIERSPRPHDYFLGSALYDYGQDQLGRGSAQTAFAALQRSTRLLRPSLEPSHPHLVRCWTEMAWAAEAMHQPAQALRLALKADGLEGAHFQANLPFMAEHHALLYREALEPASAVAVSILARADQTTRDEAAAAWTAVANSRMLILDRSIARTHSLASHSPEGDAAFRAFAAASTRLANLYARRGGQGDEAYLGLLKQAIAERDAAERVWAASAMHTTLHPEVPIALRQILHRVPRGSVLVGYVRYPSRFGGDDLARPFSYGVFVGRPTGEVAFLSLGDAGVIDPLVRHWQQRLTNASVDLRLTPDLAEQRYFSTADSLRRSVWDPLLPYLREATQAIVVPDGSINLVAFAALPTDSTHFLADQALTIRLVTAERDLIEPRAKVGKGLLAVGDPDFDASGPHPELPRHSTADALALLRRGRDCQELSDLTFGRLPATGAEADTIGRLWCRTYPSVKPEVLLGPEATKQAVKEKGPGKRVLHLATHGFAFDPECGSGAPSHSLSASGLLDLRTGLALAGANRRPASEPSGDDGVLTAEEIRSLNLSGVELVVLSACNSGGGVPVTSEGIVGLRRSFQVAGVRNLVVSLWPVADESTRAWMNAFYRELWSSQHDPTVAALGASRSLLAERRRAGRSIHPFYWGGFVAVGGGP